MLCKRNQNLIIKPSVHMELATEHKEAGMCDYLILSVIATALKSSLRSWDIPVSSLTDVVADRSNLRWVIPKAWRSKRLWEEETWWPRQKAASEERQETRSIQITLVPYVWTSLCRATLGWSHIRDGCTDSHLNSKAKDNYVLTCVLQFESFRLALWTQFIRRKWNLYI